MKKKKFNTRVYTLSDIAVAKWIISTVNGEGNIIHRHPAKQVHRPCDVAWAVKVLKWQRQFLTAVKIYRKGSGLTFNEATSIVWDILSTKGWSLGRIIREARGKRKPWRSHESGTIEYHVPERVQQKIRSSKHVLRTKYADQSDYLQSLHGFSYN